MVEEEVSIMPELIILNKYLLHDTVPLRLRRSKQITRERRKSAKCSENCSHVTVSLKVEEEDQHCSHATVSYACGGGIWRQKWMRKCQSCLS
jgi:hypothetical protein